MSMEWDARVLDWNIIGREIQGQDFRGVEFPWCGIQLSTGRDYKGKMSKDELG